jgi:protein tyrosine phosphatase
VLANDFPRKKIPNFVLEFRELQEREASLKNKEENNEGKKEKNREKNRYRNIVPYDKSRVLLKGKKPLPKVLLYFMKKKEIEFWKIFKMASVNFLK